MIAIINYGLGNLGSIHNMCTRLGISSEITDDPQSIRAADKLILPGVGHFKMGMENLRNTGLLDLLHDEVLQKKKPVLGICLGAQLMTAHSQEGDVDGLGWVDASTVRFQLDSNTHKVPHMGWSQIRRDNPTALFNGLEQPRFYFVHTYHFKFADPTQVTATAQYGYDFACAFQKGNIYGTQFHPEKSHKFGMAVLNNFSKLGDHAE